MRGRVNLDKMNNSNAFIKMSVYTIIKIQISIHFNDYRSITN